LDEPDLAAGITQWHTWYTNAPAHQPLPWSEAWLDFAPMPRLKEYLALAQKLAPLHTALKFARFLAHGIDTQWDMNGSVPMHLKKLLKTQAPQKEKP
jgi:hypothetical protein